jgi:argininosuccinate lyase
MAAMLNHTTVKAERCAALAQDPQLLATDLADYLVRKNIPFRQAHHAVGAVVALAEKTGKPLNRLSVAEYQSVSPDFGADVLDTFDLGRAMNRRRVTGAPGTKQVKQELATWHRALQKP